MYAYMIFNHQRPINSFLALRRGCINVILRRTEKVKLRKLNVAGTSNQRSRNSFYEAARANKYCPVAPNPCVCIFSVEFASG